jgi:hypothetical protein
MGAQQMALSARAVDRALERISGSILILFVGKYLWLIDISPKVLLSLRAGLVHALSRGELGYEFLSRKLLERAYQLAQLDCSSQSR